MRTTLLQFGLIIFTAFSAAGDQRATEQAPENIIKHFEWCAEAKGAAARLSRYEGFWDRHHPKDEEYEDAIHGTFVRICAYRLAALYAETKNTKKCKEMLAWLEKHDRRIPQ